MNIQEWLQTNFGISTQTQASILLSLFIILAVWLLRKALLRVTARADMDVRSKYLWEKGSQYAIYIILVLTLGPIWLGQVGNFATYLGLMTAGLAIALQEPLTDLVGWAFILLRHPFGVGDRIQVGEHRGDVIDIRMFQFSMLEVGGWVDADQSTGRVIHVPNGLVFTKEVINYSQGLDYIWDEMPVMITFESDWEKAKSGIQEIGLRHGTTITDQSDALSRDTTGGFYISYQTLRPGIFTDLRESGVLLTLRYLVEPKRRRVVREAIVEDVLRLFSAHDDLHFAYPTMRQVLTDGRHP
jgi:small-conductance mechanosensitive channel